MENFELRLWDKGTSPNRMIYPDHARLFWIHPNGSVKYGETWCTQDVVKMLWTGRIDPLGKKIYDGDFVQAAWDYPILVFWDATFARFRCRLKTGSVTDFIPLGGTVVGNRYENPELLKNIQL